MIDLYRTLGVRRNATPDTIEKAYRRKARATHPDRGGTVEAFQHVDLAYRVLSDSASRKKYDATGEVAPPRPDEGTLITIRVLSGLLNVVVNEMVKNGLDPKRSDLMTFLRHALAQARRDVQKNLDTIRKAKDVFTEIAGRAEAPEGHNLLADAARRHLAQIGQAFAEATGELAALDIAAEALKRHRYRFEVALFRSPSYPDIELTPFLSQFGFRR